jgi:hypothetical protein
MTTIDIDIKYTSGILAYILDEIVNASKFNSWNTSPMVDTYAHLWIDNPLSGPRIFVFDLEKKEFCCCGEMSGEYNFDFDIDETFQVTSVDHLENVLLFIANNQEMLTEKSAPAKIREKTPEIDPDAAYDEYLNDAASYNYMKGVAIHEGIAIQTSIQQKGKTEEYKKLLADAKAFKDMAYKSSMSYNAYLELLVNKKSSVYNINGDKIKFKPQLILDEDGGSVYD